MIRFAEMKLQPTTLEQISELRSWFPDHESLARWGGPDIPFPLTEKQFLESIYWGRMPTLSAVDEQGQLLAFGQFYPREGRCHLARLAVHPRARGQGKGRRFIRLLMEEGMKTLNARDCSLFVMGENRAAVACYTSLGFRAAPWPHDVDTLEGVEFLVCTDTSP